MSTPFGQRLALIRKEKKLSQRDLAKQLNKPYPAISNYERGMTIPSIEMVKLIADCLNVPISYFLEDQDGAEFLSNKKMIQRLKELEAIEQDDQEKILFTFDSMLRDAKARQTFNIHSEV